MGVATLRGWHVTNFRAVHPHLEAIRFDGTNVTEVAEFLGIDWPEEYEPADQILIELPDGDHSVEIGDYIARTDSKGNFWPYPRRVFEQLYEELDEFEKIPPPTHSDDAMEWAESFESHFPHSGIDATIMVGWFANYWAACRAAAE